MWRTLIFLSFLTVFSCCKGDFQPNYNSGKATAMFNGNNWTGAGEGILAHDSASFIFHKYNNLGLLRQAVSFNHIPTVVGEYELNELNSDDRPFSGFYTSTSDGDVLEDVYFILNNPSYKSIISIIQWDSTSRELVGGFDAYFAIKPAFPKKNPNNPDTITLTNGQFYVVLSK